MPYALSTIYLLSIDYLRVLSEISGTARVAAILWVICDENDYYRYDQS